MLVDWRCTSAKAACMAPPPPAALQLVMPPPSTRSPTRSGASWSRAFASSLHRFVPSSASAPPRSGLRQADA
eukprot:6199863-Prymnesium_polylepis.2